MTKNNVGIADDTNLDEYKLDTKGKVKIWQSKIISDQDVILFKLHRLQNVFFLHIQKGRFCSL
jgi:hypothetical protein